MNKKEKMDLLISKVNENQKEAFVAELRDASGKEERIELLKKYDVSLSDEEKEAFKTGISNEISDDEMDLAAGGCSMCTCHSCNAPNCM